MKKVHKKHFFYSENKTKGRTGGGQGARPPLRVSPLEGGGAQIGGLDYLIFFFISQAFTNL